jgi:hypothetical protein
MTSNAAVVNDVFMMDVPFGLAEIREPSTQQGQGELVLNGTVSQLSE